MDKILVIGIAGGTGSGKTTLMKNIISHFEGSVTVLSHETITSATTTSPTKNAAS